MIVGLIFLLTPDNSEKKHSPKKMFKFNCPTIIQGLEARQVPSFLLCQLLGFLQTPRTCREINGCHQILEFCNFLQKWLLSAEPVRICSPSTLMPPTSSTHFGYERVEPNERKPGGNKCCTILVTFRLWLSIYVSFSCYMLWCIALIDSVFLQRKLKGMLKTLSCKEMEL